MTETPSADASNEVRSRRSIIAAGATTLAGAAAIGVASSSPANAAAGDPLILGRSNTSGTAGTTVTSSSSAPTIKMHNAGAGASALMTSANSNGFAGGSYSPNAYGVSAANYSTSAGRGAAIAAGGGVNDGLVASTSNSSRAGVLGSNYAPESVDGAGVIGYGTNIAGVVAISEATDDAAAWAINPTEGPALIVAGDGYFLTDLVVYGDLYVTGRIYCDYPIEPLPAEAAVQPQTSRRESLLERAKAFIDRLAR